MGRYLNQEPPQIEKGFLMPRRGEDYYRIVDLLKQHGAILERTKKHHVYRFPDGKIWVLPRSPKSSQSYVNNFHDLKRFLGMTSEHRADERRERKIKTHRQALLIIPAGRVDLPTIKKKIAVLSIATSNKHGQYHIERVTRTTLSVLLDRALRTVGL